MKRCIKCNCLEISSNWTCTQCNWTPEFINGLPIFAKHLSGNNKSYDPSWYKELVQLEQNNFWFTSRNNILSWMAKKYLSPQANYFELGCGSGFVLQHLNKTFPTWSITASEVQIDGLKFAQSRVGSNVKLMQVDGSNIPFKHEFDVIGAYDVIEHIENDEKVLNEMHSALKPGGILFLSVPQHMFLWSQFDEVGCHYRRYSLKELKEKLKNARFEILDTTSFNSLLLPLILLSRLTLKFKKNEGEADVMREMRISKPINAVLRFILAIELKLIKIGIRWPAGGSRILLAKKI